MRAPDARRAPLVAFAACLLLGAATAAAGPGGGFTILQVNDTYKIEGLEAGRVGGLARLRTLRRELEATGRPVLVLHAGDLLFPSVMSKYLAGEPMVAALNRLDGSPELDERLIVAPGNHEFDHKDPRILFDRLGESRFLWLSSDVRFRLEGMAASAPLAGHAPNVAATRLVEVGGVKVGLFGVTLPGEPRPWAEYADLEGRVVAAAAAVAELRARGAEWVVGLTHQELGDDLRLAERVPGIDWIAGGHEHVAIDRAAGAVRVTKADADARTVVRIDVDRAEGGSLAARHRFVEMGAGIAPDPEMLGEVARWLVRLEQRVREKSGRGLLDVVATTEHALEGVEPVIRGRESALGNFLADVLRERLGTDLAFVNGGAVRINDDVPAGGDVRVYELEGIFYYDNRPVAFEATGAELLELLRRAASETELLRRSVSEAALAHGRFLQVSGLRFRYRARSAGDGETTTVAAADVEVRARGAEGWAPLDLDRRYSVGTLDWLLDNGCRDGYPLFSAGCGGTSPARLPRPDLSWRGITEEAIAALPGRRIRTGKDGRIVRLEETGGAE